VSPLIDIEVTTLNSPYIWLLLLLQSDVEDKKKGLVSSEPNLWFDVLGDALAVIENATNT
jgi:hypothetical protein